MYQALYRKYRPKSFDDVVGQAHITRTLQNEVKTGKQHMHICLPALGEPVKLPAPRFWQRRSTARIHRTEIPAGSVKFAGE